MARFTRKAVRDIIGENCTDEIENGIMALYLGVVDPMKDEISELKAKADQLDEVTKERDRLKAGDDYKAKYEKEHQDFEDFKKSIAEKDEIATKESAAKAYFEEKGITGANLAIALRGAKDEINALKINDGKIADTASLDALIGGEYAGLVSTQETRGAKMATPPSTGGKTLTKSDIFAIKDTAERQKAIKENPQLFT